MNQLYQLIQLQNDEDAKAYFERGVESFREGRFQEGIELVKEAIRRKPDFAEAYNSWGGVLGYLAQKKEGKARQELLAEGKEKCLKAESIKTGKGAYNLACVSAVMGDKAECQKWLKVGEQTGTLTTREHAMNDSDLESVRNEDWFKQIRWSDDLE